MSEITRKVLKWKCDQYEKACTSQVEQIKNLETKLLAEKEKVNTQIVLRRTEIY